MTSRAKADRARRLLFALLACGWAVLPAGCGSKSGTPAVTGKVTVAGKPLTTGSVSFRPDKAKGNTSPHEPGGDIDAQGNYKLYTAGKEGAPPGWYKVVVVATEPLDPKNPYAPPRSFLHSRYNSAETSGLAVQVVDNPAPGAYDLKLTR
jgi:hypothetical protein